MPVAPQVVRTLVSVHVVEHVWIYLNLSLFHLRCSTAIASFNSTNHHRPFPPSLCQDTSTSGQFLEARRSWLPCKLIDWRCHNDECIAKIKPGKRSQNTHRLKESSLLVNFPPSYSKKTEMRPSSPPPPSMRSLLVSWCPSANKPNVFLQLPSTALHKWRQKIGPGLWGPCVPPSFIVFCSAQHFWPGWWGRVPRVSRPTHLCDSGA